MKNLAKVLVLTILFLASASLLFAQDYQLRMDHVKYEQIERNYLHGLDSENLGLKISCAYMLGEIKSHNAIPKLTELIKNEDNSKAKLSAILALLKIAASESNLALDQNDTNSEINQICERLVSCHECLTKILDPQIKSEEVSLVSE